MDRTININKDYINFFNNNIEFPTNINELIKVLGKGINIESEGIYVWEQFGIHAWIDKEIVTGFRFYIKTTNDFMCKDKFSGNILVDNKEITKIKWKLDEYDGKEYKFGKFVLYLNEDSDFCFFDVVLEENSQQDNNNNELIEKYEIKQCKESALKFDNFNFKLCIIQELMYKQEVLLPKFDVYEFVDVYNKRKIDIEAEGYEPIKEIKEWFEKIEIPKSLACKIEELVMDGGNEIYSQIIPFWDGEDDYFDIYDITEKEIQQFPNLKHITLLPSINNAKLIEKLKEYGIEADEV